jgi:hypothetical protein
VRRGLRGVGSGGTVPSGIIGGVTRLRLLPLVMLAAITAEVYR